MSALLTEEGALPVRGRYAAIDIGTVTCRLMVADAEPCETDSDCRVIEGAGHCASEGAGHCASEGAHGVISESFGLHVLARDMAVVNLGEGVDSTRRISDAAMERTAQAIDSFLETIRALDAPSNPVVSTSVVATSASRDAENAAEFQALLADRGLDVNVISGSMEASLSFMGASASRVGEPVVVVDSGGGSTEVAMGVGGRSPERAFSFDIGCRRVTERCLGEYPPSADSVEQAREMIRASLSEWDGFKELPKGAIMLAVAGTATSAVTIRDGIAVYDPALVDGKVVTLQQLEEMLARMLKMSLPELEGVVGLEVRRAPVICAGMLILSEVMRASGVDRFTVSESDILDGMIMYNSMHPSI